MEVTVKLFGPQAQLAGREAVTLSLAEPAPTCAAVRAALADAAPALKPSLPASRLAVNQAYVDDAHRVAPGDEVALIGMVSGG